MIKLYIGFMSGTSLDGLDASLVKTDGQNHIVPIENLYIPYSENFRKKLEKLIRFDITPELFEIEQELTNYHIRATNELLQKTNLKNSSIEAIGFHGQTIYHNPYKKITWQIGNPFMLNHETNIKTIYDFRKRDIMNGGQGAPLIPIFHKALMSDEILPVAVINIGGVANITYIDKDDLIAFDTGPGNALIDDACQQFFNINHDKNGEIAQRGKANIKFVKNILKGEYFNKNYPKSLDRNEFKWILNEHSFDSDDFISSLTYLTAACIVKAIEILPKAPNKIYLCGGGSHNIYLVSLIEKLINQKYDCRILNIKEKKLLHPDFIESQGFAYLAARFCNNLPSSFPSTTGVIRPVICGAVI